MVVSTGTASGKSLVFQSFAFHQVLLNPDSVCLCSIRLKPLRQTRFVDGREWRARLILRTVASGELMDQCRSKVVRTYCNVLVSS